MRFMILFPLFLLPFLFSACAPVEEPSDDLLFQPAESDRLSRAELNNLIRHARHFAVRNSEKRKNKLSPEQCRVIMSTDPHVNIRYYGKKRGLLEISWRITKIANLIIRSRGRFDVPVQNWELEVCITQESNPVPEGLLSKELEKNIALPPK